MVRQGTTHDIFLNSPFPQFCIKYLINSKVQHLDSIKWIKNKHDHANSTIGSDEHLVINQLKFNSIYIKNRMSYRIILHMITGLKKHFHTINRSCTKMCPNCEESE